MSDRLSLDWTDVVVRETEQITATKRITPNLNANGSFSIDPDRNSVIGYHIECKAHRTIIEVDERAAQKIDDTSFCQQCRRGEPATPRQLQPETKMLMAQLLHQRLTQSMKNFLESLDL